MVCGENKIVRSPLFQWEHRDHAISLTDKVLLKRETKIETGGYATVTLFFLY
jgi:hypothetical protein